MRSRVKQPLCNRSRLPHPNVRLVQGYRVKRDNNEMVKLMPGGLRNVRNSPASFIAITKGEPPRLNWECSCAKRAFSAPECVCAEIGRANRNTTHPRKPPKRLAAISRTASLPKRFETMRQEGSRLKKSEKGWAIGDKLVGSLQWHEALIRQRRHFVGRVGHDLVFIAN